MKREIEIISYFSLETNLAKELGGWPEFVSGQNYDVDLKDLQSEETVSVRYIEKQDDWPYVSVNGNGEGILFDKVLGRVIFALAAHSDNLTIYRRDKGN